MVQKIDGPSIPTRLTSPKNTKYFNGTLLGYSLPFL